MCWTGQYGNTEVRVRRLRIYAKNYFILCLTFVAKYSIVKIKEYKMMTKTELAQRLDDIK